MILALLLAAKAAAVAKPEPPKEVVPHAAVVRAGEDVRVDLVVDGPLLGWAAPRAADGRRTLLLLAGPKPSNAKDPSCSVEPASAAAPAPDARLFRWDPARAEALDLAGEGLPAGGLDALDVDGDGADEVYLFREGGIDALAPDPGTGRWTARVAVLDEGLLQRRDDPRAVSREGSQDGALRAHGLGTVTTFARAAEGGIRAASEVDVPLEIDTSPGRARIRSRTVWPVGKLADGRMRLATTPEPIGVSRIRSILLDPDGPADGRVTEAWARFPVPERALEPAYMRLDGAPVLIVTTIAADKLSLFGEKRLRVFPLAADRTRVGVAPILAVETGINLWQSVTPRVLDLDDDGRDDLVLGYWKGLKDSIAALEIRGRQADGSFGKARTWTLDVEDGDRGAIDFGDDLDGDGRPDLAIRAGNALCVYPGGAAASALEKPVGKSPTHRVPLPDDLQHAGGGELSFGAQGLSMMLRRSVAGSPRFLDLDGDRRPEVLYAGDTAQGGRVVVVMLHPALRTGAESSKTTPR